MSSLLTIHSLLFSSLLSDPSVQRQVHRFEPHSWTTEQSRLVSGPLKQLSVDIQTPLERDTGERLLLVLDQLIGRQNMLRLAQLLSRCNSIDDDDERDDINQNQNQNGNIAIDRSDSNNTSSEHSVRSILRPLNLDKIAHRKLALACLKFLQDSIERTIDALIRRDSELFRSSISQLTAHRSIDLGGESAMATVNGKQSIGQRARMSKVEFGLRKSETSTNFELKWKPEPNSISSSTIKITPNKQEGEEHDLIDTSLRRQLPRGEHDLAIVDTFEPDADPIARALNSIMGLRQNKDINDTTFRELVAPSQASLLDPTNVGQMQSHCRLSGAHKPKMDSKHPHKQQQHLEIRRFSLSRSDSLETDSQQTETKETRIAINTKLTVENNNKSDENNFMEKKEKTWNVRRETETEVEGSNKLDENRSENRMTVPRMEIKLAKEECSSRKGREEVNASNMNQRVCCLSFEASCCCCTSRQRRLRRHRQRQINRASESNQPRLGAPKSGEGCPQCDHLNCGDSMRNSKLKTP